MKLIPQANRLLVRPDKPADKTAGGIYIPETSQDKTQKGEVIAAGDGRTSPEGKLVPNAIKSGDRILYGKYSGSEIEIDNEKLLLINEGDVLAVIDEKA